MQRRLEIGKQFNVFVCRKIVRIAAYANAGFFHDIALGCRRVCAIARKPCANLRMSIPAQAIGSKPTGVKTENQPPTSSGMT